MKRYYTYILLFFVASLLLSCAKGQLVDGGYEGGETIITVPVGDYISFQADVNTRAALVEDLYLSEPFGVYAYYYDFSKLWSGQRAIAVPNLMYNGTADAKLPLQVSEENGSYAYNATNADADANGQIPWQGGSRHAFFGYYPYSHSSITRSSMTAEGAPYLEYRVDKANAANLVDIMTGHVYDITAASNQKTVTFKMNHRTAGVDLAICNAYQYSYALLDENGDVQKDDNGDDIFVDENITLEVQSLTLDFSNLTYDTAKIYLEKNDAVDSTTKPEYSNESGNTTAHYELITSQQDIEQSNGNNTIVTADTGTSMTFIPQTEHLRVKAVIKYKKRRPGGAGYLDIPYKEQEVDENGKVKTDENGDPVWQTITPDANNVYTSTKISTFEQPLKEGSRYYIILTFTSAAVSINIVTAAAWDEVPVEYEFM